MRYVMHVHHTMFLSIFIHFKEKKIHYAEVRTTTHKSIELITCLLHSQVLLKKSQNSLKSNIGIKVSFKSSSQISAGVTFEFSNNPSIFLYSWWLPLIIRYLEANNLNPSLRTRTISFEITHQLRFVWIYTLRLWSLCKSFNINIISMITLKKLLCLCSLCILKFILLEKFHKSFNINICIIITLQKFLQLCSLCFGSNFCLRNSTSSLRTTLVSSLFKSSSAISAGVTSTFSNKISIGPYSWWSPLIPR